MLDFDSTATFYFILKVAVVKSPHPNSKENLTIRKVKDQNI